MIPSFFVKEERKKEFMDDILKVLPNETEDECLFRIGEAKRDGLLDLNWTEIADFFLQCGADITDIIIRFTSKDKDSALSEEFNKTINFCDLHNIPYEIVEE